MIKPIHYNEHKLNVYVKDSTETVQKSWSWGNFYDLEQLKFAEITCKHGSAVDIGAGIGNHTLFFSKVMDRRTFSFEPDNSKYEALRKNIILNNPRTMIYNYALADYAGHARKEKNEGIIYFRNTKEVFNVKVNILSNFIWEFIGLIRINIPEENVISVLSGGKRVIKENKPHLFIKTEKPDEVEGYLNTMLKVKYQFKKDFGKAKYFKPI